jgi:hypothetical protein
VGANHPTHITSAISSRAPLGRKASDEFAVPLCRTHHREVHRAGDEHARWRTAGVDPLKVARKLWKEARVNEGRIERNPIPQRADPLLTSEPRDPKKPTRA